MTSRGKKASPPTPNWVAPNLDLNVALARSVWLCIHERERDPLRVEMVPGESLRIGRAPDMDIVLHDETQVSRHHCTLTCGNQGIHLFEDRSTNGTEVNGQHRRGITTPVHAGSTLRIGSAWVHVVAPTAAGTHEMFEQLVEELRPWPTLIAFPLVQALVEHDENRRAKLQLEAIEHVFHLTTLACLSQLTGLETIQLLEKILPDQPLSMGTKLSLFERVTSPPERLGRKGSPLIKLAADLRSALEQAKTASSLRNEAAHSPSDFSRHAGRIEGLFLKVLRACSEWATLEFCAVIDGHHIAFRGWPRTYPVELARDLTIECRLQYDQWEVGFGDQVLFGSFANGIAGLFVARKLAPRCRPEDYVRLIDASS